MHYSKPSTLSKPAHTKQPLIDGFIRKKVKADSKEPKSSKGQNDENKLIEEPIAPTFAIKTPLVKPTYSLPHTDWNWNIIKQKIQPIAEGRCTLDEIVKTIEYALIQKSGMKEIDLSLLKHLFNKFGQHNRQHAEEKVLPCIAKLVIRTPELFPSSIPLMVQGTPERVKLSKEQCACLLANMFMGTIIKPKTVKVPQYYNFHCWYYKTSKINEQTNLQKLACLYYYFSEIANGIPERYIIFERLVLKEAKHGKNKMNDWRTCTMPLKGVVIHETGKMEDSTGTIQVDFANRFLGGFVLTPEIAQEEILFTISPECMVGILFSEQMLDEEAILIQGVETYCKYTGYRKHFRFAGPANQNLNVNQDKVLDREIVAIDALNMRDAAIDEFSAQGIIRELNKAYIGFNASDDLGSTQKKPIATGRWGCGVFQANVQLKFLLQWLAASKAGRDMWFYSFEDKSIKPAEKIIKKYGNRTVGDLVSDLFKVAGFFGRHLHPKKDLFTFLDDM